MLLHVCMNVRGDSTEMTGRGRGLKIVCLKSDCLLKSESHLIIKVLVIPWGQDKQTKQ